MFFESTGIDVETLGWVHRRQDIAIALGPWISAWRWALGVMRTMPNHRHSIFHPPIIFRSHCWARLFALVPSWCLTAAP